MKKLILAILLTTSLFAQYTSADKELVRTTFQRTFDKNYINSFIFSHSQKP